MKEKKILLRLDCKIYFLFRDGFLKIRWLKIVKIFFKKFIYIKRIIRDFMFFIFMKYWGCINFLIYRNLFRVY